MKKLLSSFILGAVLLAGCGSAAASSKETVSPTTTQSAAASTETTETAAAEETVSDGKVLVLYFSGSGHTKKIADMIAEDTGGDEYEIAPSQPYTTDDLNYSDENSRVVKEHEDESLQDVAFDSYDVPDWDSYATVYVGYPIWWQDASWVMKSYVKHLDFTGKTVIPFATSSASDLGDSGKHLAEIAGTGDWKEGQRFSASASQEDVNSWIESLGF